MLSAYALRAVAPAGSRSYSGRRIQPEGEESGVDRRGIVGVSVPFRDYLEGLGEVFAVFDRQDSANVAYGVQTDSGRLWIKHAASGGLEITFSGPAVV